MTSAPAVSRVSIEPVATLGRHVEGRAAGPVHRVLGRFALQEEARDDEPPVRTPDGGA